MSKTKIGLLLAGILLIAGFFRFYHVTTTPPGLYMDEAMDGVNAQNVAETGQYKVYYPEDNGREGLYVNILAVAYKYHILPDNEPWSVRFPAAVAGFLTVLGLYLLISELFSSRNPQSEIRNSEIEKLRITDYGLKGKAIALLSAFFLATSFWHINFSRIGFRAILAPFCLVWATYFLLKAIRNSQSGIRQWIYAILGGIVYGLGFYTYIAFRITPLLLLLFLAFRKNKDFWKRILLFLIATFIVALPIGWYYLHHTADFFGRTSQISVTSSGSPIMTVLTNSTKTALMFNWHGDFNWRHNFSGAPELFWPVGILFILGIILAIYSLSKKNYGLRITDSKKEPADQGPSQIRNSKFAIRFLILWFALSALPEILSNDGIPHALRSLLMVIPACVFAAIGTVWLYELLAKKINRHWMTVIAIVFVIGIIAGAYKEYFIDWAHNPNVPGSFNADYVQIGREINALPSTTQKYVVIYAGGVIDYGLPMPVEPVLYVTRSFVPNATAQKFVNNIHYLLPNETNQIPAGTPSNTIFEIR